MENSIMMETSNEYEYIENMYNYSDYYDLDLVNEESRYETRHIVYLVIPIILSTVVVLSVIGNILVVVISVLCMRPRSLTSIFILNLALSDLLFTVGLVLLICDYIWGFIHRDTACKLNVFFLSAGFYSSTVFLVLMSVQRYIAVVHPHTAWKKGRWVTHILICSWMMSILAALPVTGVCTHSNATARLATTYKANIIFVCAFLFMAFSYIRILQTIFKSATNQKHRTTGLIFLLVATFFMFWAPFNIIIFLDTLPYDQIRLLKQDLQHFYNIRLICSLLACIRCCLNPVIYGLFGLIFRKTARAALNSAQTANEHLHVES